MYAGNPWLYYRMMGGCICFSCVGYHCTGCPNYSIGVKKIWFVWEKGGLVYPKIFSPEARCGFCYVEGNIPSCQIDPPSLVLVVLVSKLGAYSENPRMYCGPEAFDHRIRGFEF